MLTLKMQMASFANNLHQNLMDVNYLRGLQWLALVFSALILGFFIATEHYIIAAMLLCLIVVPIFVVFINSIIGSKQDAIFWILFAAIMLSSLGSAITRSSLSFVATGILLAVSPMIIYNVFRESKGFNGLKIPLFLLGCFYALGIASSFTGRSAFFPAVYSFVMSLKPILLLGIGATFVWSDRTQKIFSMVTKWSWLPLLIVALIQWFAPSIFRLMVPDADLSPDPNPFFPGFLRASSLFAQSSVLAAYSSIIGLILISEGVVNKKRSSIYNSIFYLLLLMMSGQRQEILAFFTGVPLIYIMYRYSPRISVLLLLSAFGLALVLSFIYFIIPDVFQAEMQNWDFSGSGSGVNLSARAVLYADSFGLANRYWPMGTGFGTFASVGAVKFDQSLYVDLGYRAFWWYIQQKSWLMDAYWAKYIAETGWIGFYLQLLIYLVVMQAIVSWIRDARVKENSEAIKNCIIAFIGLFYVLATSPTAFNLSEPHGGLIPLMFVGIAWRSVNSLKANQLTPPGVK